MAKKVVYGELKHSADAIAVIMAGGSGTRFWPLSRSKLPKQFLPLAGGERTLLQDTAQRVEALTSAKGILVVTRDDQKELVFSQLPQAAVAAEPQGRNTAPCLGLAAIYVLKNVGDVPLICLPSDHIIDGLPEITKVFRRAIEIASADDVLVTIGIKATRPETGYGYIKRGLSVAGKGKGKDEGAFAVEGFVEKPNEEKAREYLADGGYYWNSGMFVWRPSVILAAIKQCVPELYAGLVEIGEHLKDGGKFEKVAELYGKLPAVSIDVGVLEKAENVVMLPGETFSWSDVGSWSSWVEFFQGENRSANIVRGSSVLLHECEGCGVISDTKRVVTGVGLSDIIVVDTPEALLVVHKDRAQEVKNLVDLLVKNRHDEVL